MSEIPLIFDHLKDIEEKHDVDILFAVVTGSRMWGYSGPDSDYDVRFVYRPRDPQRYSSYRLIGKGYQDTIQWESPDRFFDCTGWDLPKFLRQIQAQNTSIVEWCLSPLVLISATKPAGKSFGDQVLEHVTKFTRADQLIPAYRGMILSKKCSGLENVKRAISTARLLLTLTVLEQGRVPKSLAFNDLLRDVSAVISSTSPSSWSEEDVSMLKRLYIDKVEKGAKHEKVDEDIKQMLLQKINNTRSMSCCEQGDYNDDTAAEDLDRIWECWREKA